jgi:hypothetical protein
MAWKKIIVYFLKNKSIVYFMNLLLSNNTGCTFNELTRVFFIAFLKLIFFSIPYFDNELVNNWYFYFLFFLWRNPVHMTWVMSLIFFLVYLNFIFGSFYKIEYFLNTNMFLFVCFVWLIEIWHPNLFWFVFFYIVLS